MLWAAWLVILLVLLGAEAMTQAFFAIFLAVGALAAAILDLIGVPFWIQAVAFVVVGLVSLLALRPLARRSFGMENRGVPVPGGTVVVGASAVVLDQVGDEHHPGHVQLGRESWLASTDVATGLPAGTRVTVVALRGTTLFVRPEEMA